MKVNNFHDTAQKLTTATVNICIRAATAIRPHVVAFVKFLLSVWRTAHPRHIKWSIAAVWVAFVVAFLCSDFFLIAARFGLFAALQMGAVIGPMRKASGYTCEWQHLVPESDCGDYPVPAFHISLKFLCGLAVVLSVAMKFWASERERSMKSSGEAV